MYSAARRSRRALDIWPGYVDALSALLMLVIFVLLVFTFAQFLLSEVLSTKEGELADLQQRFDRLTEMLGLERKKNTELDARVADLSGMISRLTEEKFELTGQVQDLNRKRDADQERIRRQLMTLASLQQDIDALRRVREQLEQRVGALSQTLDARLAELGEARDRAKTLAARLADAEERTLLSQQDVAERDIRIEALSALVGQQQQALDAQRRLSADAQAEVTLLNQKIADLQAQLQEINQALAAAEASKKTQADKIEKLGQRLNIALARQVNKLERYRSKFFGRLREVLGDNPMVRVEGDRFLFQSELLFASGSAELGEPGKQQLRKLAGTLKEIEDRIPKEIDWILRIDGHTDRVPIHSARFASNWELSTARAVSVVRYLASQGIPPKRMAAAGFGEFHPLDPATTQAAYRRNRRIEIKLTTP